MASATDEAFGTGVVPTVVVHTSGPVVGADRAYAAQAFEHVLELSPVAVPFATVDLRVEPGWPRPALARVTVRHGDHLVQAHADSFTIPEAVDILGLRLRRRLDDLRELGAAGGRAWPRQDT